MQIRLMQVASGCLYSATDCLVTRSPIRYTTQAIQPYNAAVLLRGCPQLSTPTLKVKLLSLTM